MSIPSVDAPETHSYPTPYDPTTLQQRIHREIVGISALSNFLAAFQPQSISSTTSVHPALPETAASMGEMPKQDAKTEMIRIRLDDEFWVDMTPDQVTEFIRRKEASLQAVEERRENLAQLQEWMIRELRDMTGVVSESTTDGREDVVPAKLEETSPNVPDAVQGTPEEATAITEIIPPPATTLVRASPAASAATKDTVQKLDDINSALAKFGTSMEQVLKLDPQAGDGTGTSAQGVEVGNDGTVLNEEGLPFLDIREDPSLPVDTGMGMDVPVGTATSEPAADDYWSEEAVERRRRLREKLFAGEDDDDEDEDEDEDEVEEDEVEEDEVEEDEDQEYDDNRNNSAVQRDEKPTLKPDAKPTPPPESTTKPTARDPSVIPLPEPDTVTPDTPKGKGKAVPRKRGFMARSMVIDHSQEEKEAEMENGEQAAQESGMTEVPAATDVPSLSDRASVSHTSASAPRAASPSPALKSAEAEGNVSGERRKSVTFNPQTRVRLYEKGEIMPIASGTPAPVTTSAGSRFELLPDDQDGKTVKETCSGAASIVKKPAPTATSAKNKDSGTFSGFKKGFLDKGQSKKQNGKTNQSSPVVAPSAPLAPVKAAVAPTPEPMVVESPEYHQPLAPAHEKPTRTKKQSVFAQRKAEAQNKREQLMNFRSFDPMPTQPVGTGAPASTAKAPLPNPMKMAVVERPVAVAHPPAMPKPSAGPIPTEPSPQHFPPTVKRSRDAPEVPLGDGSAVKSGKQTAVQETVMERKPAATSSTQATAIPSDETDPTDLHDSDSDSLADFEYSDGEDAFDMDEALLAREAALAYHAKRSALGRKGLGGWTGNIGPDGEVEWDTEIVPMSAGMEEAPPRTGAVAFGERILPPGFDGLRLPVSTEGDHDSSDGEEHGDTASDGFASISLPQVIPASENLASSIKIGKLENGNLVVQDTDDSDEDAEPAQVEDALTADERNAREQAAEERRQRKAMIDRLMKGDVAEMIREEREREELFRLNGSGYIEPAPEAPPALENSPKVVPAKTPSASSTVSERPGKSGSNTTRQKDVVPATGIVPVTSKVNTEAGEEEVRPKKVSKFKAARMAASS